MKHAVRSTCILFALVLAAAAHAEDVKRRAPEDPLPGPTRKAISPLAQKEATRAREAELESTKSFGGSSPLVIPAAAFATKGNSDDTYFFHPFNGAMRGKSTTDGCVQAPVYLPYLAELFQMYASILDEDAGADVYVTLMRSDNTAYHDADPMASTHTNGSSSTIQTPFDETIDDPVISYPRYHYWVELCLPSANTQLYSVRLYFTDAEEVFSDSFESGSTSAWSSVTP
jgi:hypothetical protein